MSYSKEEKGKREKKGKGEGEGKVNQKILTVA